MLLKYQSEHLVKKTDLVLWKQLSIGRCKLKRHQSAFLETPLEYMAAVTATRALSVMETPKLVRRILSAVSTTTV